MGMIDPSKYGDKIQYYEAIRSLFVKVGKYFGVEYNGLTIDEALQENVFDKFEDGEITSQDVEVVSLLYLADLIHQLSINLPEGDHETKARLTAFDLELQRLQKDEPGIKRYETLMAAISDVKKKLDAPKKEGTKSVNIIGDVKVEKPKWYESFGYDEMAKKIKEVFSNLTLKISSEKPLDVRMVDVKGNPISNHGGGDRVSFGGSSYEVVGLKDSANKRINPATEDKQIESLELQQSSDDSLVILRRIAKLLESSAVVDVNSRQRVAVENLTSFVQGTGGGVGVPAANVPTAAAPGQASSISYIPVWVGPVDQRYLLIDQARNTYANSIRSQLTF